MKNSGVLLHISSLPSPWGIGTLGKAARDFIDFLAAAGQQYWQILPICPTGYGDSPYQSFASFAGNPYFIDLDSLCADGLLRPEEYRQIHWGSDPERADYGLLYRERTGVLRIAARRFLQDPGEEFRDFCSRNSFWLEDYALFMTIKEHHGNVAWTDWPEDYRTREASALAAFRKEHEQELLLWKVQQFLFFEQWYGVLQYAEKKGIRIIGDIPIYVSLDSADVWAHPELFQLDGELVPEEISGCPPDGFSETGQVWGNPLFDWERMKEDGYAWWTQRIRYLSEIYHVIRIDHFRGFESYFAIPYGDDSAANGVWRKGPGLDFFRTVESVTGKLPIIAENLGFLTPTVEELLQETGYPGMKVLEMAFDHRDPAGSEYLPENYDEHCVAYIGTHDNDTAAGWLRNGPPEDVREAVRYLGLTDPEAYNWEMMRALWQSAAGITIVQAQDLLGLGSEARMNTPSVPSGNWQWRAKPDAFTARLAEKLREEMNRCGR